MSAAPCASSRRTSTSSPAASDSRWTLALAQLSGHLTPRRSSVSRAMLHPARCGRRGHPARGQVVEPGGDRRLELVDRTARRRRQPGEPGELRAGRDALAVAVRPRRPVRVGRELRHGSPRACAAPGRPWRSHGVPPGDSKRRRPRGARCGARAPAAPSRSRAGATGAAPPRGAGHAGGAGPSRGAPGRSPSRARATRDPGHSQCIGAEWSCRPQRRELGRTPLLSCPLPPRTVQSANPSSPMETYTLRPRPDARPDHRYRIDYAGELNRAQYEAATTLEGPVLVIAGAGSGKTRTLVYRVARLVESGVNPGQILLLTFTRKAAEEMLRRAAALGGASCERVAGGTFHSFANLVLRRTARHVGLEPNFTILDRGDSEDVVNLLRSRAGLDRKDRRFPRKSAILEILSMAVNRAKPLVDVVTESYLHLAEHLEVESSP